MELKLGYKQTEIGVIPNDWDVTTMSSLATVQGGMAFNSKKFLTDGTYQVIKMSNLYGGNLLLNRSASFINDPSSEELKYLINRGDILITLTGTVGKEDYGYVYLVTNEKYLLLNQRVARIIANSKVDSRYLAYQVRMNAFKKQFFESSRGGTGNQANVGTKDIDKIFIHLPPTITEQTAITQVLSDTDELISSLDKLITKKRNIKQGSMQQLLTGKKRLPGFIGEWETKKLGEIAKIYRGASPRPIENPIWFDESSLIGWVRISDVTKSVKYLWQTTQKLSQAGITSSRFIESGNLIMSICATIGRPILTKFDVCIHDGFVVFANPQIEKDYLYYFLTFIENDWAKNGQTGSQMNLNTTIINSTMISFPKEQKEQTTIAQILSDMDSEIETLEKKREKYKTIKQGMMQELLTGRIRLV